MLGNYPYILCTEKRLGRPDARMPFKDLMWDLMQAVGRVFGFEDLHSPHIGSRIYVRDSFLAMALVGP